ncbi:hypothetical protein [Pseudalkalibacillus hwajinpoensis]|uniref:WYL domain-containing protein n=1 Tax=Guptibacillus hwajinpoensis TaxID=208199 RepID=A0A4U1MGY5_9BACL|nr:hypothetical protein [Pseudalkalibacillus hwajinpoensis]TKD70213.1 hypothetical protein FBF83_13295 [Pseudalkalibacillus hwajinpoensis]
MQSIMRKALLKQEPVEIIYLSQDNVTTQRFVTFHSMNDLEATGYCHLRRSLRTFKLERILAVYPYRFRLRTKQLYA